MNKTFDVDALFVITKETVSKSEEVLIDANSISTYINSLTELLAALHSAEQDLDPKFKGHLILLKKDITELTGLTKDPSIDEESLEFTEVVAKISARLDSISEEDPILANVFENLKNTLTGLKIALTSNYLTPGAEDTPVGYTKVLVDKANKLEKYVIDTEFLDNLNEQLEAYKKINVPSELTGALKSVVNKEIDKLESLKTKYLKNRIIDIMLHIVSDRNSAARSLTSISFKPLGQALDEIPEELQATNENYDLSNPKQRFLAYLSVSSGQSLIGAFANGSKSYGYIARAGAEHAAEDLFKTLTILKRSLRLYKDLKTDLNPTVSKELTKLFTQYFFETEEGEKLVEIKNVADLNKAVEYLEDVYRKEVSTISGATKELMPPLNNMYRFNIVDNGLDTTYDKLASIDSDGYLKIVQAYSTLTNAAVDDLNEGYLSRARINTNTGNAIIGMVALGVPFRLAIKLLYQPILAPLSGGKVSNINSWMSQLKKNYGQALDELAEEPLNVQEDLEPFINGMWHLQTMTPTELFKSMNPAQARSQLKVLALFEKAHKVGTDFKNLASFLNVIRQWDVFLEDVLSVEDKLVEQIGTVQTNSDGDIVLTPRLDFSFFIPNLFNGLPHVKEAYLAHKEISETSNKFFRIHNSVIKDLANRVRERSSVENNESKNYDIYVIQKALQHYLTSGRVSSKLKDPKIRTYDEIVTINGQPKKITRKFLLSGTRSFMDRVSKDIEKVKLYASKEGHDNLFLENIVPVQDKYSMNSLSFRTGVGLKPEDIQEIMLGFKHLNRYDIVDGKVIEVLPPSPNAVSTLQKDLLDYAILASGLSYSGNGYSSFIPSYLIKIVDDYTNLKLDELIKEPHMPGLVDHFTLGFNLLNGSKLKYVPWEDMHKVAKQVGEKTVYELDGIDEIEQLLEDGTTENVKIYFNIKVNFPVDDEGKVNEIKHKFIRREYGKSVSVYKLVLSTESASYYQLVGKANNAVYDPLDTQSGQGYKVDDYFDPYSATVGYSLIDNDKRTFTSYSKLLNHLKPGDELYIYPDYSYDRINRMKVKIVSKAQSELSSAIEVKYEPVSELVTKPTYPSLLEDENLKDYAARLKTLGFNELQINEAIKEYCK